MESVSGQKPEEQATPAATGEAHVCVTQIDSPYGLTITTTIIGTAEQVRTAQAVLNTPVSIEAIPDALRRSGSASLR